MQQFQNYLTNQYQQPIYQPMQNPYMDRIQMQNQQMTQTQMPGMNQGMLARMVDNFENITANDVPMNGGALFVKNDGSEIQFRQWTSQGTIEKTSYLAQKSNLDSQMIKSSTEEEKLILGANKEVLEGILNKVDMLSDKIDEILKQKPTSRGKKEVLNDE